MKKKACSTLIVYLHFDHVFLANFQIYTTKGHYIERAQKPYAETKPHTLNWRITVEKDTCALSISDCKNTKRGWEEEIETYLATLNPGYISHFYIFCLDEFRFDTCLRSKRK